MTHTVVLHRDAKKDIKKLHPQIRNRVIAAFAEIKLSVNARRLIAKFYCVVIIVKQFFKRK